MDLNEFIALETAKLALSNTLALHPLHDHFKVGKTVQDLSVRYGQKYADKYDDIELLYDGKTDGALVDWLEEEMIKYCWEAYGREECENEQIGGGQKCEDNADKNNPAKLYVVWR